MAVLLDTAVLPRRDRTEAFHAAMMSASVPSRVEHEDPDGDVHARMDFWQLGTPDLFRNEGSGIRLVRTPKHVRIGGPERLALAVQVTGSGVFGQGGIDRRIRTGELMLVDLTAPYDFAWRGLGASQAFQIDPRRRFRHGREVTECGVTKARPRGRALWSSVTAVVRYAMRDSRGATGSPLPRG